MCESSTCIRRLKIIIMTEIDEAQRQFVDLIKFVYQYQNIENSRRMNNVCSLRGSKCFGLVRYEHFKHNS